jgi:hypothetical protein
MWEIELPRMELLLM